MKNSRRALAIGLSLAVLAGPPFLASALAEQPAINTLSGGFFDSRTGVAIRGYDPVAYFTVGRPEKGLDTLVYAWRGAQWKFASQANLDLFRADPEKYAPQYGGYCAYGVANDNLVSIEPDKFRIIDGKLYLNYDAAVQSKWLLDTRGYIEKANAKFPALLGK